MSITIPTEIEKCKGAMIATAIGDALGWPIESRAKNTVKNLNVNDYFVEWTRHCGRPNWHYEQILPGEYSDDTQMTLSVARSIIAGNWEKVLIEKELPFWLEYERGGGKALLKAAGSCKKGLVLWKSNYTRDYFNAGGNGAVMRILPHVIAAAHSSDLKRLLEDIIKDSIITHGHPRAILGATCYAYTLNYLLKKETTLEYGELVTAVIDGQNVWGEFPNLSTFSAWCEAASHHPDYEYAREWDNIRANMVKQLEFVKTSLKKGLMLDDTKVLTQLECFAKVNGAGDVAILAAIYLASKYANNPSLGIKVPAFSIGADTDTIASITGGLLGMLCGTNWIPTEWKVVQDYDCFIQITELLLSDNSKEAAKMMVSGVKEQGANWKTTPIGLMRMLSSSTIQSGKTTTVIITKHQSVLGQTMYFKDYRSNNYEPRQQNGQIHFQLSANEVNMPVPTQKPVMLQEHQRQFMLGTVEIASLLNDPQFERVTLRKVLQIVNSLLDSSNSSASIAKQFKVKQTVVDQIKFYIR